MRKYFPLQLHCISRRKFLCGRVQPEAASVIALQFQIALNTVSRKTAFCEHHSHMRSRTAHAECHDITGILPAENMCMAPVIPAGHTVRVTILQRK